MKLKTFYFLRHAEGYHNEAEAKFGTALWDAVESLKDEYTDPDLTPHGRQQCAALAEVMPAALADGFKPELIIVSPLKRTLRTSELCLKSTLYSTLPVVSVEHARETLGEHTCDRRSPIATMTKEFPEVQFHYIEHDHDPIWTEVRESEELELIRAQRYLDFLFSLPEEHIVLVGHSGILCALSNLFWRGHSSNDPLPISTAVNTAMSHDALLQMFRRDGALGTPNMISRHCEIQPFIVARMPLQYGIPPAMTRPDGTRKKIGFVTYSGEATLTHDDRAVMLRLAELGYDLAPVVWDAPHLGSEWKELDGLVLRSCWNYHHKTKEFTAWIDQLEQYEAEHGLKVANPIAANRWNLNKLYLHTIGSLGGKVPLTRHFVGRRNVDAPSAYSFDSDSILAAVGAIASHSGLREVVLKPAVSMSGHDTVRVSTDEHAAILQHAQRILVEEGRDLLVQEFLPEIHTTGECSYIFFNGTFSHAIRKLPKQSGSTTTPPPQHHQQQQQQQLSEFRCQAEYGGSSVEFLPTKHFMRKARDYLDFIPESDRILCCRVDAIERGNELILMELEVIDPSLYLASSAGAPQRWAQAMVDYFAPPLIPITHTTNAEISTPSTAFPTTHVARL